MASTINDMLYIVIGQSYEHDMAATGSDCESDDTLSEQITECISHSPDMIDKDTLLYIMNMMQFSPHLKHEILKNLNLLSDSEEFVKLLEDFKEQKISIEEAALAIKRHKSLQTIAEDTSSNQKEYLE